MPLLSWLGSGNQAHQAQRYFTPLPKVNLLIVPTAIFNQMHFRTQEKSNQVFIANIITKRPKFPRFLGCVYLFVTDLSWISWLTVTFMKLIDVAITLESENRNRFPVWFYPRQILGKPTKFTVIRITHKIQMKEEWSTSFEDLLARLKQGTAR